MITKSILHLVATNVISPENFVAGLKETFEYAPDLFIDIPMLYDYLGKILAPHIEKKVIKDYFLSLICVHMRNCKPNENEVGKFGNQFNNVYTQKQCTSTSRLQGRFESSF